MYVEDQSMQKVQMEVLYEVLAVPIPQSLTTEERCLLSTPKENKYISRRK